jgi:hypothetical protein
VTVKITSLSWQTTVIVTNKLLVACKYICNNITILEKRTPQHRKLLGSFAVLMCSLILAKHAFKLSAEHTTLVQSVVCYTATSQTAKHSVFAVVLADDKRA